MSAVLAWKDENNASADEAAVYYLTNYQDQWQGWLSDEARDEPLVASEPGLISKMDGVGTNIGPVFFVRRVSPGWPRKGEDRWQHMISFSKPSGLEDWCTAAAKTPRRCRWMRSSRKAPERRPRHRSGICPFPSMDALNDACAAFPQSRNVTLGLENGFLA